MRPYADDLRQKVLHAVDTQQGSYSFLARVFGVSASWMKAVVRRRRQTGHTHALTGTPGPAPKLSPALLAWLRLELERVPDRTEAELQRCLLAARGVAVSQPTISRALTTRELPRKKRACTPASGTPRRPQRGVSCGTPKPSRLTRSGWSLLMRPAPRST